MNSKYLLSLISIAIMLSGCTTAGVESVVAPQDPQSSSPNAQTAPAESASVEETQLAVDLDYVIVDTGQVYCYDDSDGIACPAEGEAFAGQDAQYAGVQPQYVDNGDGTITDLNTGLTWQQDPGDKVSYDRAVAGAASLSIGGYNDWRLPTIKELYSLIDFSGDDPSGCETESSCPGLEPFIDTDYFVFEYGDTSANERIIDSQFISSTEYVSTTMEGFTVFGVNFADGRIKGYGTGKMPGQTQDKQFFVLYVRGNIDYGNNDFVDNSNGTISDLATGLTWTQDDNGTGVNWEDALEYCEILELAGNSDWRVPNAKELQSIVDYSRSPDTTNSAAIDPLFNSTTITNETGELDYGSYWSSTTHTNWLAGGSTAAYVSFGRSLGYMRNSWVDVHGAGSQRSDPKTGDPGDYPTGRGPQGDAIRIYNLVRCVSDNVAGEMSTGGEVDQTSRVPTFPGGGNEQPGGPPSDASSGIPGGQPPQEAIVACTGLSDGAACTVNTPQGQLNGTCTTIQGQLACVPEGGPPPPGG